MATLMDRLDLAYSKLGLREAFIAAVMTRVKREVSDKVSTAGTNGTWVRYNPAFCDPLTDEELFGLVLHESCHIVMMHMWRREGRDPRIWNYANDALINAYIKSRGWQLPKGGVHLGWVKEEHSSEYVYNKLKEQQQEQQKSKVAVAMVMVMRMTAWAVASMALATLRMLRMTRPVWTWRRPSLLRPRWPRTAAKAPA